MVKPLSLSLVFTLFNPDTVSDFPILLHSCTYLKSIFLGFVCRKGIPLTNKTSMAGSTFWWYFYIREGKGILGMVLWCSGLLLIALTCMMGIWGPYMASSLLMSLVVIRQFLIWFFWMDYFRVCVDGIPKSCCNIIASSDHFISLMWKHDLLLSMVLRNV